MTENKGDLISREALKKAINDFYDNHFKGFVSIELITYAKALDDAIDNAPTVAFPFEICGNTCQVVRPQGECKDCETCEDKAKQYSLGFQDGYLTSSFQLTELRRWLIAQGYSEGTVDDKINEFTGFVEKIRGEE